MTRTIRSLLIGMGITLVGGECAEIAHLKDPARHVDMEHARPLDAGKFRVQTVVTTTSVSSGGPVFLKSF